MQLHTIDNEIYVHDRCDKYNIAPTVVGLYIYKESHQNQIKYTKSMLHGIESVSSYLYH